MNSTHTISSCIMLASDLNSQGFNWIVFKMKTVYIVETSMQ